MPRGEHQTSCAVCGGFELVPKGPDDYAEWLSDKTVEQPASPARKAKAK